MWNSLDSDYFSVWHSIYCLGDVSLSPFSLDPADNSHLQGPLALESTLTDSSDLTVLLWSAHSQTVVIQQCYFGVHTHRQ